MAILTSFPGLEVDIVVNGNALREYDTHKDSDEPTEKSDSAIKYVEAQPGQEFAIRVRANRQFRYRQHDLTYRVYSDGEFQGSGTICKENYIRGTMSTREGVKRSVAGRIVLRKFQFSTLITDDRPVSGTDTARASKLGDIIVSFHRTNIQGPITRKNTYAPDDLQGPQSVAEKALKGRALSRTIDLGTAIPSRPGTSVKKNYIDPKDKPFAIFTFRYRSMDDLYAEMIVPRPVPLEERDPESLSVEEMRELLRRQEANLERRNLRRQIEGNRAVLSGSQGIKGELKREHDSSLAESSGSASRRRRIETVDLTDD
ncbi:hypothetical protein Vi05172_g4764 [Venturia inaequalis]|nr:hypothetical protein Vi05172_g4764 [Venturia inaequalis]